MKILPARTADAVKTGATGTGGARAPQTAAETTIIDTGGDFTATNVEDALAELAAAIGGPIDAIPQTLIDAKGDLVVGSAADTAARLAAGTDGYRLQARAGATLGVEWVAEYVTVPFFLSGGSSVLSTGLGLWLPLYLVGTIVGCTLDSFESGSIVIDIGKAQESTWAGSHFASICAAAKPTISAARRGGSALTGWTTSIVMDDMLTFNVDSVTSVKRVAGALKVRRTG